MQRKNFADGLLRFVCAMMQKVGIVTRLRSYRVPEGNDQDPTILQAALATSAAPTYFSKVKIDGSSYIDGALGSNNPTQELEEEANDILCSRKNDLKTRVACFLSVGTGRMDLDSVSDRGILRLVEALKKEATETERTHASALDRWRTPGQESRYFRFNVEQGLNEVKLAEFNKRDTIQAGTIAYLQRHDVRDRLECCVDNLMTRQRRSVPAISPASILIRPDNSTCASVMTLWQNCSLILRRSLTIRARRQHVLKSVSI
jgi:predicted acylesterase/phospholipase RssA